VYIKYSSDRQAEKGRERRGRGRAGGKRVRAHVSYKECVHERKMHRERERERRMDMDMGER